jgi:hypothetical protein
LKLAFVCIGNCFNRFFAKTGRDCGRILSPAVDIGYTPGITAKDGKND